jgi:hypothetical protein
MFSQTTLFLALAAGACAHMRLADPLPFGLATLSSSPLAPADFPCKQRSGVYAIDAINQWNAGETNKIKIMGTAAHGGGSCQYSITTDPEPTKDSQWKVIHSVIGNCLTVEEGNFPDLGSPLTTLNATQHPVTMPSNIPDGRYTFAWTWLNKVGQREFYMNCAPIQVGSGTGTASTKSAAEALSALPDMFVANLPNSECATVEGQDFLYPNPGQSVAKGTVGVKFGADFDSKNNTGCPVQTKMGAGAGSIGSPSPGTPSTPSQGAPPSTPSQSTPPSVPSQSTTPTKPSGTPAQPQVSQQPAASPSSGYGAPQQSKIPTNPNGGIHAPGASSAPASGSTPQASPPAAAKPTPSAMKPVPSTTPQTPGDNNTTPANGECTPCTNDGAVVCIGSKQFGLCNRGCAVAQDLAAGMACSGGVVVASTKRHVHFPRAHLHRRFSASRFL